MNANPMTVNLWSTPSTPANIWNEPTPSRIARRANRLYWSSFQPGCAESSIWEPEMDAFWRWSKRRIRKPRLSRSIFLQP